MMTLTIEVSGNRISVTANPVLIAKVTNNDVLGEP